MMRKRKALFLISAFAISLQPVWAQPVVSDAPQGLCKCPAELKHVLNGHPFLPTFAIPTPFADSQAIVALGFGYGTFESPVLGRILELKLGEFQPIAQGQVSLFSGFALSFGVKANVITGLNQAALLDYGASTSYTLQAGAIYELIRAKSDVLSLALDVSRPHSFAVSPLEAARAGLERIGGSADPNFASENVTTRWAPSARFAHAFSGFAGFQTFLGGRFDNTIENEQETTVKTVVNFGGGLSGDFKQLAGIPIGLTANYRRAQVVSSESGSNSDAFTLGLFEPFSATVNVGLELGLVKAGSGDVKVAALLARATYN